MRTVHRAEVAQKSERVRFRRALGLLAMTLVLPGSAQLMRGNKAVGRAALRVVGLVVAGLIGGFLYLGRDGVIKLGLDPVAVAAAKTTVVVLATCWVGLFVDAWRLGRPPTLLRTHRILATTLTLGLVAAVAVPSAYGARLLTTQSDILNELIVPGPKAEVVDGRLNILLLGGDGELDRVGVRTDSINVASIDVRTGRTVLISLPRNLQWAQFPQGTAMAKQFPNGFEPFFFGIYTWASGRPDLFPGAKDPGALAVEQAVAQMTGLTIHHYALVNLQGFQSVINALGGITIRVEKRIPIGGGTSLSGVPQPIKGYIEPGLQKLNGYRAMWYARSRSGEMQGDYARMARQRCVFGAILREADPVTVLTHYQELAKSAKRVITTDITTGTLQMLVDVAAKTKKEGVTSLQFTNAIMNSANPDINFMRAKVAEVIEKSKTAAPKKPAAAKPATGKAGTKGTKAKPTGTPKPKPVKAGDAVAIDDTCKYV